MIHIKGDLILKEDYKIEDDLNVKGSILSKDGKWNIDAWNINAANIDAWDIKAGNIDAWDIKAGNIDAWNINARNIDARNIDAWNINAANIDAWDIKAGNINAWDIKAGNISFFAICIAYKSFKCKSAQARRDNFVLKCLDGEIVYGK